MTATLSTTEAEINALVLKRSKLRQQRDYKSADRIKNLLEDRFQVEIADFADGSYRWQFIKPKEEPEVVWSSIEPIVVSSLTEEGGSVENLIPLIIATVDAPHYKKRLDETMDHLRLSNTRCDHPLQIQPEPCHLLDLRKDPSIGAKRVLMEGWRNILIPRLLELAEPQRSKLPFVLVAEDDIRLPHGTNWGRICNECTNLFSQSQSPSQSPSPDIVSMGHAWSGVSARNTDLLSHLHNGGGVHGTTLLAISLPDGVLKLHHQMKLNAKSTHWDQYLFHSASHKLSVALSDPPLVGWSEVEETLTSSGTGNRRRSGGRHSFLPPVTDHIQWVVRKVTTKYKDTSNPKEK